ncbi:helix-turn-helix domain-containing protein [Kordia sp. YSTF-M3]|uniref:Helix-turn-helix domain-containing protein n=1 Tax=Kordia aestuariivivens TaxID=2759037 RepID=A0ABR7Q3V1_9FLAO|nr:helix-turn-helix domain-containing protein [Kordia aestuariivivens]MBC8753239.1 helix-turn-helix domain-containing protein [Kordia aestuariivivens]
MAKYSYKELNKFYLKYLYNESNKAKIYADKLFENAQKKNDSLKLFYAYRRYAVLENNKGNHDQAVEYIETARDIATTQLKDRNLEVLSIFLKGKILYDYGKYEEAFENYSIAYSFYKDSNPRMTYMVSHNIALVENILGDQEAALKILLKNYNYYNSFSEEERKSNSYSYSYLSTLIALTDTYVKYAANEEDLKKSLLDSAEIYNEIGLKESLRVDNVSRYIYFLTEYGIINHEKGEYQKAISELNIAERKAIQQGEKVLLTSIYYYIGVSYKKLGQEEKAIDFLRKTDSVSQKNVANYILLDRTYYTLTDFYSKKGDGKNTLKYWELYKENRKINEHVSKSVKSAIRDHDMEKLEDQIKRLIADQEEKENNYTVALIIIIVLIFLFLLFLVYSKGKQRQNEAKFQNLLKELKTKKEIVPVKKEKSKPTLTIDEEKIQQILTALDKFEQKKLFLDVNCDLAFVAKKVKTNKAYLSKVIHSEKQQKFIQYITNLRITFALEKLKEDKLFRSYDIKSIASELGFKSPDSFSRAFKSKTGIYPSYYIKNINKINTSEDIQEPLIR